MCTCTSFLTNKISDVKWRKPLIRLFKVQNEVLRYVNVSSQH